MGITNKLTHQERQRLIKEAYTHFDTKYPHWPEWRKMRQVNYRLGLYEPVIRKAEREWVCKWECTLVYIGVGSAIIFGLIGVMI